MRPASDIRKIAFLGDYLPRKCGIATSTMAAEFPEMQCLVVPVNDLEGDPDHPAEVVSRLKSRTSLHICARRIL